MFVAKAKCGFFWLLLCICYSKRVSCALNTASTTSYKVSLASVLLVICFLGLVFGPTYLNFLSLRLWSDFVDCAHQHSCAAVNYSTSVLLIKWSVVLVAAYSQVVLLIQEWRQLPKIGGAKLPDLPLLLHTSNKMQVGGRRRPRFCYAIQRV